MGVRVTEIRRAAPRFLRAFAARLRESDAREVLGASGVGRDGLERHVSAEIAAAAEAGGRVWAVTDGRVPLALFGVRPDSLTSRSAAVWMLASADADRRPLAFGRWSRRCLAVALEAFPQAGAFYNYAPQAGRSAEWLRWLGAWFSARDGFVSPWTGETFMRFVIEREEVS